jgi:hypothetical protein
MPRRSKQPSRREIDRIQDEILREIALVREWSAI